MPDLATIWFAIVSLMLAAYVVLDGFDFGAGALHLLVAKTDAERRQVLNAIGPFWDGNEVWLLAAGGALFCAFPRVLSAGLSGFYFAIFLVLWCLIGRGVAIEFRSHVEDALWRGFFDVVFAGASLLLAVLFGAALGNVLRGVPLDADGWFALPLFTDGTTRPPVGILDAYTVLVAVFALLALAGHGANFLCWKTAGPVAERSRRLAGGLWWTVAGLWPLVTWSTARIQPSMVDHFGARPLAWLSVLIALGGLVAVFLGRSRARPLQSFLGSSAVLGGLLAATAACVYPVMLRSTGEGAALDALSANAGEPGLRENLQQHLFNEETDNRVLGKLNPPVTS